MLAVVTFMLLTLIRYAFYIPLSWHKAQLQKSVAITKFTHFQWKVVATKF